MTERLEQWEAREKIRGDVGWAAVYVGLAGILGVVVAAMEFAGSGEARFLGTVLPAAIAAPLLLAEGLALVACAVGLWNARGWARWVAAFLFAGACVQSVVRIVRDGSIDLTILFCFFPAVYLLLPSTGRRFARARGPDRT